MSERPAAVWPAASYVREFMTDRDWSIDDLAERMNVDHTSVEAILEGGLLRSETFYAERLAAAFGTSIQVWLNLDKAFWDALASGCYYLKKGERERTP